MKGLIEMVRFRRGLTQEELNGIAVLAEGNLLRLSTELFMAGFEPATNKEYATTMQLLYSVCEESVRLYNKRIDTQSHWPINFRESTKSIPALIADLRLMDVLNNNHHNEELFIEASGNIALFFISIFNDGKCTASYEEMMKLDSLGYVSLREWLVHPAHWRLALEHEVERFNEKSDVPVIMGLDSSIFAKTDDAIVAGHELMIFNKEDLTSQSLQHVKPALMFEQVLPT